MTHRNDLHVLINTLASVVLSTTTLSAQSDAELTARNAKNTVFTQIDEESNTLQFISNRTDVDDIQWEYATKEEEPLLLIQDNSYNLRLRMTNPLKYRVTVDGKLYEEDTYDKTLRNLAGNVQTLLGWVTNGANKFGSVTSDQLRAADTEFVTGKTVSIRSDEIQLTKPTAGSSGVVQSNEKTKGVKDFEMRRAILTLLQTMDGEGLEIPTTNRTETDKLIKVITDSVMAIESEIEVDLIANATRIINRMVAVDLATQGSSDAIQELEKLISALGKTNDRLADRINALKGLTLDSLLSRFHKLELVEEQRALEKKALEVAVGRSAREQPENAVPDSTSWYWKDSVWEEGYWKRQREQGLAFVELALQQFASRMSAYQKERGVLITNLIELLHIVQSAQLRTSKTEHGTELLTGQFIPKGKVEKVTLGVKKRSFSISKNFGVEVKETDMFTRELKFMRAHLFYPQIFPALVFVDAVYPEFMATEDSTGVQRVQRKENALGYVNVAGMVNFNIKLGRKTEVPFLQIGTSLKRSQPQLFIGGGIRLSEWFGLSAGAVMSWQGQLDALAVGDRVTNQDAIDNDLKYSLSSPQLYFAIQLRPSTLTKKPD